MPVEDKPNAPLVEDASTEHKPAPREPVSLKRGREGSVDPFANEAFSAAHIAAKKNRLEEDAPEPHSEADEDAVSQNAEPNADANSETPGEPSAKKEGHTVGEVRRKVQEMNWKEGEPRPADDIAEDDKAPSPSEKAITDEASEGANADTSKTSDDADGSDWVKVDKSETASDDAAVESDAPSLKRKANETANSDTVEEKKRKSTSPTPNDTPSKPAAETSPAPAEPPKKPQATFGSFSSKPSPFASMAGTSAFGAASTKSAFDATSTKSAFGAASTKSAFGEAASKPNAFDAAGSKPNSFASSGFGSYSSAFSPFAAKKKAEVDDKAGQSSFGDILKEKGGEESTEDKKPQLDRQDVPTGEEEEETMYQTRAKLFMMEAEGAWKERGVGLLKLNKRRQDGGGARLVMRADGVLRVILNSGLYVGMSCLEDGKHVRMTIFEDGERRFVTIRTASTKIAAELASAIHDHTPLESPKKATSTSPGGPDDSAV